VNDKQKYLQERDALMCLDSVTLGKTRVKGTMASRAIIETFIVFVLLLLVVPVVLSLKCYLVPLLQPDIYAFEYCLSQQIL